MQAEGGDEERKEGKYKQQKAQVLGLRSRQAKLKGEGRNHLSVL